MATSQSPPVQQVLEDGFAPVAELISALPVPAQKRHNPLRHVEPSPDMWVVKPSEAISSAARRSLAARALAGPAGMVETWICLEDQGPRIDPIGLSRSQAASRRPRAWKSALGFGSIEPETVGRCPANVDPGRVLRGDLAAGVAGGENGLHARES